MYVFSKVKEEILFFKPLEADTKGEYIFGFVKQFFEKSIPLDIIACATDGASSMIGRYRGFITHLKRIVSMYFVFIVSYVASV